MNKRTNLFILLFLIVVISVGIMSQDKEEVDSRSQPKVAKTPWPVPSAGLDEDHKICSHSSYDGNSDYYTLLAEGSAKRYLLRGLGYANREQWAKAEENYRQALSLEPEGIPVHFHLAEAEFATGRYEQAAQTLSRIIELEPKYFQAYGELSLCLQRLGLEEESRKNWNLYRQVRPRTEYEYNHLAKMFYERGQFRECWQMANDGLTVAPDMSVLMAKRAQAMIPLGYPEAAWLDLTNAINDRPFCVSYYRDRIQASGDDAAQVKADEETIARLQSEVLP